MYYQTMKWHRVHVSTSIGVFILLHLRTMAQEVLYCPRGTLPRHGISRILLQLGPSNDYRQREGPAREDADWTNHPFRQVTHAQPTAGPVGAPFLFPLQPCVKPLAREVANLASPGERPNSTSTSTQWREKRLLVPTHH